MLRARHVWLLQGIWSRTLGLPIGELAVGGEGQLQLAPLSGLELHAPGRSNLLRPPTLLQRAPPPLFAERPKSLTLEAMLAHATAKA